MMAVVWKVMKIGMKKMLGQLQSDLTHKDMDRFA